MTDQAARRRSDWMTHHDGGFIDDLGPLRIHGREEEARFAPLTEARHESRHGVVRGAVIIGLINHSLGIFCSDLLSGLKLVAVPLNVSFVAGGKIGDILVVEPALTRATWSVAFLRGTCATIEGRVVAQRKGSGSSCTRTRHLF